LITGIKNTYYTVTGLTTGTVYKFRVLSRNLFDTSVYSNVKQELAAQMPDAPAAPTTTISSSNVVVDWNAPSD